MADTRRIASGARIVLLAEGDTEELAIRHFISRQWKIDGLQSIALRIDNLGSHLEQIGTKANLYLSEENVLGVFTLIDLYGMNRVTHSAEDSLQEKITRVQYWLRSTVNHVRSRDFFPHISVHEIEACILAEGVTLAKRLGSRTVSPDANAEQKNFQNPPSRRLNDLFLTHKKTRYHKIIDGRPLFSNLEFQPVYRACPYFRSFYDQLRDVGRKAIT